MSAHQGWGNLMDLDRAESRFRVLQAQYRAGELAEATYHLEVAKLLWRDDHGTYWMLDPDDGLWYQNRGDGWEPGDPRVSSQPSSTADTVRQARRRWLPFLALGGVVLALLVLAAGLVLERVPVDLLYASRDPLQPTQLPDIEVQVTIASPADSSQVPLGQMVSIESMVDAGPYLPAVAEVILRVDDQIIDVQPLEGKIQPDQTSFPLAQPWRPEATGEHMILVTALSHEDEPLDEAGLTLYVTEVPDPALPESACAPDATFVADVTIPPDTAFPPGVRMDKVWQVRNSGPCAWGVGYELVLLEGDRLGAPATVPVAPVAAGELVDLAVTMWAPFEAGTYTNTWQLRSSESALFGPTLSLNVQVEAQARESVPPPAPADVKASLAEDKKSVRLTWLDQSDDEDAFRIYRSDLLASIGLAPADSEQFVDQAVACGHTYRYTIVAFNAAGTSASDPPAEVSLPPCAPKDEPPSLTLTVVPTQVQASETFVVVYDALDDVALDLVVVWGVETDEPTLDAGQVFTCTGMLCRGRWPVTWTQEASGPLTLVGVALDSAGQQSAPAQTSVSVIPSE